MTLRSSARIRSCDKPRPNKKRMKSILALTLLAVASLTLVIAQEPQRCGKELLDKSCNQLHGRLGAGYFQRQQ